MNRFSRIAALAALPALLLLSCAQQENVTTSTDASSIESNQEIASAKPWDKPQRMMESMQYRYDKWADPVTGEIDYRNYYKALAQADRIAQGPSAKANYDLSWDALGPDNQGGRTRTILIDRDDRNLMFTGSVAGGLYRSNNRGDSWEYMDNYPGFSAISSIVQSADGTIYVGTGEGFASYQSPTGVSFTPAAPGNGVWKSSDKGQTWEFLSSTAYYSPGASGVENVTNPGGWAIVNRLAAHPTNPNIIAAAVVNGLYVSQDGGLTWSQRPGSNAQDVKWSPDGNRLYGTISGRLWYTDNFGVNWASSSLSTSGRTEIGVTPANPDYIYLSNANGQGCFNGLWVSDNKGITFTRVADNTNFDPFAQPSGTAGCQGGYDNAIAVSPCDETLVYIGGITFYTWSNNSGGLRRADVIGTEGGSAPNADYLHADKHTILFDPFDATCNTMWVGNDGGLSVASRAKDGFPDNLQFQEKNFGYQSLQCWSVGAGFYGESACGAQDNGSQYIDGLGNSSKASSRYIGGDGGYAEISHLNPDIVFGGSQNGNLRRSTNRGGSVQTFFDSNIDEGGCGFPSGCLWSPSQTCESIENSTSKFVTFFTLAETDNVVNPPNSAYVAARADFVNNNGVLIPGETINAGTTVNAVSGKTGIEFPVTLTAAVLPGDTLFLPDPYDAKLFMSTSCGVWVCTNPLDKVNGQVWYKITSQDADGMAVSEDLNTLYCVRGSSFFTVSNLNGATFPAGGSQNPSAVLGLITTSSSVPGGGSMEGVAVDPNDPNHVLVVKTSYAASSHVYRTNNALANTPTFVSLQNNDSQMPYMPFYDATIDFNDANRYLVATELGVWGSDDGGTTWSEQNTNLGRVPTYGVRQFRYCDDDPSCRAIYVGTHSRGMWRTTTLNGASCSSSCKLPTDIPSVAQDVTDLIIQPNPVANTTILSLDLVNGADVRIRVIDLSGRLVKEFQTQSLGAGTQEIPLDVSDIRQGAYAVVVSTTGGRENRSVMMVKK